MKPKNLESEAAVIPGNVGICSGFLEFALAALRATIFSGGVPVYLDGGYPSSIQGTDETELAAEEILDAVEAQRTQSISRIMEKMKRGVHTAGWTKEVHMYLQQQLDAVPELLRSFQRWR